MADSLWQTLLKVQMPNLDIEKYVDVVDLHVSDLGYERIVWVGVC